MRFKAPDTSRLAHVVDTLDQIVQHRKANPTTRCDEMYYELVAKYFHNLLNAKEEGKPIAALGDVITPELLYAMDIVPFNISGVGVAAMIIERGYQDYFASAKNLGLNSEICSNHRAAAAAFADGFMPHPDVVISSNMVCDNSVKSPELLVEGCNAAGFFLDRPYRKSEEAIQYFAQELQDLVAFLEERTGRKLDYDRLREALDLTRQLSELHQEAYELRKAIPSPTSNRRGGHMHNARRYWTGRPEGVEFMRAARDEMRANVEAGKGHAPEERFRLESMFLPPHFAWKILDWMEREHGACIVADPYYSRWGEMDWDLSRPLDTLARYYFELPSGRQMMGPLSESMVADAVEDARSHGAEGAIYWAHVGCRQACAIIRTVKDALQEQAGIPMLVVDLDVADPSYAGEDEIKDRLEGFFEMLEDRK